ncbi:hypothetical protein TcCL_NonESM05876 [Trypanosoma cruzi]|nr:hypothetical protein TcCL_NonESM05876 [Trypanosoma cruzi]
MTGGRANASAAEGYVRQVMESLHAVVDGIFCWRCQRIAAALDIAEDEKPAAVTVLHRVAAWRTLRCEATVLPPAWPALSTGCQIENHPFQWVPFSICMCCAHSV